MGHRVRTRRISAGALEPLAQAIADAKKMFGLAAEARVISCYEAGREGFGLHRYLTGRATLITWWIRRASKSIGGPILLRTDTLGGFEVAEDQVTAHRQVGSHDVQFDQ